MNLLKLLLIAQRKHPKKTGKTAGFTLIELLVGLIMALLIITPLLGFMVNMLRTERDQQAKVNSDQEIQTATEFISRDLQQAVYIYDREGVNAIADANGIPAADANKIPVLVFWKRKFIPNAVPLTAGTNPVQCDTNAVQCNDTFVFALVAYYLIVDDGTNNNWSGAARIGRLEIQDSVRNVAGGTYANDTTNTNLPARARRDPGFEFVLSDLPGTTLRAKMLNWEKRAGETIGSPDILVDYIDQSTTGTFPQERCPANPPGSTAPGWQQVPDYGTANNQFKTYSFYSCVNSEKRTAQVFLRGNALARLTNKNNVPTYSEGKRAFFPTAKMEVKATGELRAPDR